MDKKKCPTKDQGDSNKNPSNNYQAANTRNLLTETITGDKSINNLNTQKEKK